MAINFTILKNQFTYIDKEFRLTTINKQNSFYYRVTKPIEVWGNYHTQIAFFDRQNEIVYHRQTCFAHALQVDNSLEFVKWSNNGDAALFYEYRRGHIEGDGIYHYLFLDLTEKTVYRIDLYKYEYSFLDNLRTYQFDKNDIINQLIKIDIDKEQCYADEIVFSPIKWLIGVEKWQPKGRL